MSKKMLLLLLCACFATLFLAACASTTPPAPMPSADTPHMVVLPSLALGTHQNIVFATSDYDGPSNPTSFTGVLRRYDVITHTATVILKLPDISIQDAQISANGEWIVFVARLTDHDELRIVRVDGKYAQTLLYSQPYAALSHLQWSPNQQYILFDEEPPQSGPFITYLLDILHNRLQMEIVPSNNASAQSYFPRKWLDNTHVLLVGTVPNDYTTPQNIYIFDIRKGARQSVNSLRQVYTGTLACTDVDSNGDGSQLFISFCPNPKVPLTASTLVMQPTTGGTVQTIFTSQHVGIQQIRFLAPHTLLLLAQDALWKINTDGTGLTQISPSTAEHVAPFWNQYTQYAWSNISRDGTLYGLQETYIGTDTSSTSLTYSSLNGGAAQTIASAFSGLVAPPSKVALIGWIVM